MLRAIASALSRDGRSATVSRYSAHHHESETTSLRGRPVFNMAYGYCDPASGRSFSQPEVAQRLEELGARLIGSDSEGLRIAQDKSLCAEMLAAHGIASPRPIAPDAEADSIAIRKPRFGASHRGVAIMRLAEADALPASPDVLVQEYIAGPEYTIGVVGGRALPPARVVIAGARGPTALGATPGEIQLEADPNTPACLGSLVERVGEILGLRDYFRVDIRMRGDVPVVLDVNGLPQLDPESSFLPLLAGLAGRPYDHLIVEILQSAERRWMSEPVDAS
jgi:D-alanine-D-alanine ligase